MSAKVEKLFPTLISSGNLSGAAAFNKKLLAEMKRFSVEDKMGEAWSRENYRGGYTSYASLSDLHRRSPVFNEFSERMTPHVKTFAKAHKWDVKGMHFEMTALWMNFMPKGTYHTLHHHPFSTISGAYYVSIPKNSVALKLEDPRISFYMNAPVRSLYHEIAPLEGGFVLFESWLRHEVPPNLSATPRISLSFNYSIEVAEL